MPNDELVGSRDMVGKGGGSSGSSETPQAGDIISDGSHVGIVSKPGETAISASDTNGKGEVIENDWGFREGDNVKVWHYTR